MNRYGVSTWEDFIGLPFEDLELLGKAGKKNSRNIFTR